MSTSVVIPAAQLVAYLQGYRAGGGRVLMGRETAVQLKGWAGQIRRSTTDPGIEVLCRAFAREVVGCRRDEAMELAQQLYAAVQRTEMTE